MERKISRVLRSSNWTGMNKNGGGKDRRSIELANTECVKNIQKFLGLANYYHQFIKGFATIARSLHNMVRKDQK